MGNTITALATVSAVALTQYLSNRRDNRHRLDMLENMLDRVSSVDEFETQLKQGGLIESINTLRLVASKDVFIPSRNLARKIKAMAGEITDEGLSLADVQARYEKDTPTLMHCSPPT